MEQADTKNELRVLMLEDTPTDAELAERELRKAGIAFTSIRVETRDAFVRALEEFRPDIILSDYKLPDFDGMAALEIVQRDHPEVPVVMVTGALTDTKAVELIHAGAKDYVLKDRLARLAPAVQRALAAAQSDRERVAAEKALRESEARYKRITEGLTDYLYTVRVENGHATETRQSPSSVTVTGYEPEEFAADPYLWIQMVMPEDREMVKEHVRQILSGKDVPPIEYRIIRKDGKIRWVSDTTILCKDASGKLLSYDSLIKDITDTKQAEQELKRSNAELEQFSYAISHDMRQPLRMISSYLGLLEKRLGGQLDGEKREFFNFAIDGAQRLDQMLVALLEYSRVGRKGEPSAWIESRELLDEALLFLQPAIAEAQAELHISGDWPRVFVSRDEMMRLIQNLIGNAVKYRVAGRTPEITVASETVGNEWRLSVADNGVGIIPDQIGRLFQVFQRLHTRAAYEGTGIGLALCRKIVEHHGGQIGASSPGEGLGSTFRVKLPLIASEATEDRFNTNDMANFHAPPSSNDLRRPGSANDQGVP